MPALSGSHRRDQSRVVLAGQRGGRVITGGHESQRRGGDPHPVEARRQAWLWGSRRDRRPLQHGSLRRTESTASHSTMPTAAVGSPSLLAHVSLMLAPDAAVRWTFVAVTCHSSSIAGCPAAGAPPHLHRCAVPCLAKWREFADGGPHMTLPAGQSETRYCSSEGLAVASHRRLRPSGRRGQPAAALAGVY